MPYIGGVGVYRQTCDEVAASGSRGFEIHCPRNENSTTRIRRLLRRAVRSLALLTRSPGALVGQDRRRRTCRGHRQSGAIGTKVTID
jgi:hypothetical protein